MEELIRKSISIHKEIDKFFPEDTVAKAKPETATNSRSSVKDVGNPMQIVILSACRSDQAILYRNSSSIKKQIEKLDKIHYQSMAHALIRTGIPCVIGMSHPISKMGAEIFTRRLYRTLLERKESIYKAVRQVRLELFAHIDSLPPSDWLTPVLYSRNSQTISVSK